MKKQILIILIALAFPLVSFANPLVVGSHIGEVTRWVNGVYIPFPGTTEGRISLHNQCEQWKLGTDDQERNNYFQLCDGDRAYNMELKINELESRIVELEANQSSIFTQLSTLNNMISNSLKSIIVLLINKK